ncbi:hypothetical protein NQ317_018233 [Molorchus minor]|uniref:UNC93-like protein n=1 Tax=Molorchus minor TaxID=1323400 RepID=A0ABQ9K4F2_9CUCU|nr:hypothetical protein NQ317_018233 [Molorchus minor]
MGSLPNLHELGKDQRTDQGYRPGPALGHLCGGCNGTLSSTERSKILHRYSGHNKIIKARSNPHDSNKIVNDDFMVEHMAVYSPVSTRSRYNLALQGGFSRRRDSMNSSIGATSVRRLLAVVRGGPHGSQTGRSGVPVYTKRVLIINLVVICIGHLLCSTAFMPFLTIQSSVSVWNRPLASPGTDIKTGSLLMSAMYATAAIFALIAPCAMLVFYLCHLYPILYVTVPACLLMGAVQGVLSCAHISFLMILSHRITGLFHEDDEEGRQARMTCIIRRVARAFQGAQDFGLILGSVLSAILITYTVNGYSNATIVMDDHPECSEYILFQDCYGNFTSSRPHCRNPTQMIRISTSNHYDYNAILDDIFDSTEDGRLCGSNACPASTSSSVNSTLRDADFRVLPPQSADILVGSIRRRLRCRLALGGVGLGQDEDAGISGTRCLCWDSSLSCFHFRIRWRGGEAVAALRAVRESFRDVRLQMAAPLAFFIGIEQAFFSYVVCTLGLHRVNLVFLAMGLLQSVAACTLSMLLRTIRRYYVVAVGFTFHGCLLMVLNLWKPTEDDPALFYVISASWGVCNAIWEMMNFTLLTGQYADNWESAFANMAFFKFFGFSVAFMFHGLLCNYWKLYGLAFFMLAAVVPFAWLEIRLENMRKIRNITRL